MTRRNYNPKTQKLIDIAGSNISLRLTAADREFLKDLSKVQLISKDQAAGTHYQHLSTKGSRSLQRLVNAGIIHERIVSVAGKGHIKAYEFSSHEMAVAWGGRLPRTGSSRSDYHELITSEVYFRLDRPDDFRLPTKFSNADKKMVGQHLPDAVYTDTDTGELVIVESDAGNYSAPQIFEKSSSWRSRGLRQVWAQPSKVTSRVEAQPGLDVMLV